MATEPAEYVRVKDPDTKHEYSLPVGGDLEGLELLKDTPAVDHNGDPLPATHHTPQASKKADTTSGGN